MVHPVYYFLYFKKLFDSFLDTKTLNKFTTPYIANNLYEIVKVNIEKYILKKKPDRVIPIYKKFELKFLRSLKSVIALYFSGVYSGTHETV